MTFLRISRTIFKSLVKRPYTVKYPFGPRVYHGNITRGSLQIEIKDCVFCGMCQRKCPTGALEVSKEAKTWTIDRMRCITCSSCVEACPKKCLRMERDYTPPATSKEKEIHANA